MGHESHVVVGINAMGFSLIVLISTMFAYLLRRKQITFIPESGASMILGMFVGMILLLVTKRESEEVMFHPEIFFYVLLPPIIFEAGFSLQRKSFFSNMGSILLFSVIGTFISTMIVGYGLYGLAAAGVVPLNASDPLEALMYGALISAVDPVATLSILGSDTVGADPLLYSLVFGESVLNDAVSIVLFKTFKNFHGRGAFTDVQIIEVIGEFIGISIGSIVVGALVGLLSAFITTKTKISDYYEVEFIVVLFMAYIAYCAAEIMELSGIMSLFFCGIVMAHYTWYNLSKISQTTTKWGFHSFSIITENFVFAYLGITAIVSIRPDFNFRWSATLCFFTMILCVIGRFLNIFPLSILANIRRRKKISSKMQLVMWFAGLRGAIAFALSLNMPEDKRAYAVTTTLVVVIFTTLVCGGFTETVLRRLGLQGNNSQDDVISVQSEPFLAEENNDKLNDNNDDNEQKKNDQVEQKLNKNSHENMVSNDNDNDDDDDIPGFGLKLTSDGNYSAHGFHQWWHRVDRQYMYPLFGGRSIPPDEVNIQLSALQSDLDSDMMMMNDGL